MSRNGSDSPGSHGGGDTPGGHGQTSANNGNQGNNVGSSGDGYYEDPNVPDSWAAQQNAPTAPNGALARASAAERARAGMSGRGYYEDPTKPDSWAERQNRIDQGRMGWNPSGPRIGDEVPNAVGPAQGLVDETKHNIDLAEKGMMTPEQRRSAAAALRAEIGPRGAATQSQVSKAATLDGYDSGPAQVSGLLANLGVTFGTLNPAAGRMADKTIRSGFGYNRSNQINKELGLDKTNPAVDAAGAGLTDFVTAGLTAPVNAKIGSMVPAGVPTPSVAPDWRSTYVNAPPPNPTPAPSAPTEGGGNTMLAGINKARQAFGAQPTQAPNVSVNYDPLQGLLMRA